MRFNTSKCEILQVGTGTRTLPNNFYTLNGDVLKLVSSAKYLGVLATHNLSWSEHIRSVTAKANAKLGWARRNLRGCPFKLREIAYTTLIRPGLEYSDSIWDPTNKEDISLLDQVLNRLHAGLRVRVSSKLVASLPSSVSSAGFHSAIDDGTTDSLFSIRSVMACWQ